MNFADAIKDSVLEKFNSGNLTTTSIVITLGGSVLMGLFIYLVYRLTVRGGSYSHNFNKTLALLPPITAGIMLAMQSNLVISLGMVGALSIVRFRNAVKDPSDLGFLFWSISIGIIVGAGLFELAILLSLCIAVLIALLNLLPTLRAPYMLVVSGDRGTDEQTLLDIINKHATRVKVRSRNITKRGTEWIFELQSKNGEALLRDVSDVQGVVSANVLSHDGDVRF